MTTWRPFAPNLMPTSAITMSETADHDGAERAITMGETCTHTSAALVDSPAANRKRPHAPGRACADASPKRDAAMSAVRLIAQGSRSLRPIGRLRRLDAARVAFASRVQRGAASAMAHTAPQSGTWVS
jgi:hypothetical protein